MSNPTITVSILLITSSGDSPVTSLSGAAQPHPVSPLSVSNFNIMLVVWLTVSYAIVYGIANGISNLKDSIDNLGLTKASDKALEEFIEKLIQQNLPIVKEKGERAIGGLMGDVMKHFKKNIDGEIANKLLKEKIREINKK